ncbi:hypothetical protein OSTOST_25823, partial [Ostertagia ostertagi]
MDFRPFNTAYRHGLPTSHCWHVLLYSLVHFGESRSIVSLTSRISHVVKCLTIVAMILILVAPGACFSRYLNGQPISREICPGQNSIFPMNADRWSNALHFQGRGENVYGQVALIVVSLFLALVTVGISCVHLAIGSNLTYTVSKF